MRDRLVLGTILIALLLGLLWLDGYLDRLSCPAWLTNLGYPHPTLPPGIVLFIVMLGLSIMAARELADILHDKAIDASRRITTLAAFFGLCVSCFIPRNFSDGASTLGPHWDSATGGLIVSSSAVLVLIVALRFYSRHKNTEGVIAAAGGTMLAFVYLGLMFGFVLAIRREHPVWTVAWVLLMIKACDIGAYFTGRAVGKRKLILWLSPGKTWEGLIGGVVASMAVGIAGVWLIQWKEPPSHPFAVGALTGMIFGLIGQAGDLMMSLFKRDAGIKDSGKSLPGFGGVLDVLDSPLLVAPFAYWWLRIMLPPHG
ncbi:MAG: phosphatidate cytidylyltransferase [Phycisphaeraceae bacterium]|nr:phosphatidate cytidylyltransferase [Phycisphaeraceae bacterium]